QAEDGIRDWSVTGVQTCALPICLLLSPVVATPRKIRCRANEQFVTLAGMEGLDVNKFAPGLRDEAARRCTRCQCRVACRRWLRRSEEHTSELQSLTNLVCRLLLE